MGGRTLRDYADEWRASGAEAFRRKHDSPVLVLREAADDEEDAAFHTEVISARELGRPLTPRPRSEEVFVVQKRVGGVFQDRIGVGRAKNADVSLPLRHVSKYHAYFMETDDGGWSLTDAGSKNGTEVEGRLLDPKESERLEDGSDVRFGPYLFKFYGPDAFATLIARRAG